MSLLNRMNVSRFSRCGGFSWSLPLARSSSIITPVRPPRSCRLFHAKRTFSKESSSSAASDLHSHVSQTLRAPPSSASPPPPVGDPDAPRGWVQQILRHPGRRARYYQALWNAGSAFMLLLMAAQSFKASRERRRVTAELEAAQAESAERLALLQAVLDDATIDRLVQDIVVDVPAKQDTTFWFGRKQQQQQSEDGAERLRVTKVLLKHFDELIGSKALDDAEREALRMRVAEAYEKQAPPDERNAVAIETSAAPTPPPKRVPFTM